ncbi:(Fe-S)-binding protein [Mesorhizobium sp. M4B.F.Ca.ET.215.01.1.1]|uniref:(Fe-S)-binding protein n=1 Tax=unclassified Mesorhizobium TaxID=325217 RepID=UPI000FCC77B5|nr:MULTISPECIES: (Fe-S)-binding protein [unclassified Mesorhizobium]RUW27705.1 (Fe-S)-binding protein [Mesorhizobium sp. M4B.F.Ca.ET.013.02.1.1]RVD34093.1 (Fe-S)-binding protein [Mesorhizobium sp. M4B.F.Ca.ET.019.03.1.1]RWF63552.1 MAG: (Fe-S)-binding protein [Mesorhizobium sp.]TGQ18299.1 (Fe-S)-binding protein [Mesorhizobium sp. M4B.F.Ca.ET.215.01.1.1]TGQ27266.1 (Fe-S)-binding protein [Mesorhizobium sp. M00.F.Ca.ET.220.01.1.1]
MLPVDETSFETVLGERVQDMLDACTRCGKCVEVCPSVVPAGIPEAKSEDLIGGILDLVRTGNGPETSREWAASCMLSGECIKACDYGVNPRFLLTMARLSVAKADKELAERRRQGVERYREVSRGVTMLSRLQLDTEVLERLGQKSASVSMPTEPADFVFYTGCNVLKTPHIALLALDIMDELSISYQVMGGPSHCCGISQLKAGDAEMTGRMGSSSMEKLSHSRLGQVITWCPTCYVQFTENILPTVERQRGSRPFEMKPFMRFLRDRLAQLRPHLQHRVDIRVALHKHPGVAGVVEAATEILKMVPGIELVELHQPAVGLQSVHVGVLPKFKRELQLRELEAARDAGVDALVAVYHSDHRELCAHERDWPFRIINILEVIGESMGLHHHDRYKQLKLMHDADQIVTECSDLIARHSLDPNDARDVVVRVLLGDQPLPLRG